MLVLIHLYDCIEALFQGMAICREADYREDDCCGIIVGTDAKELRDVTGIDVVATRGSSVAGQDREIRACCLLARETEAL